MAEAASSSWRITVITTGEIKQTERAFASPEEALSAAKEHAIRAIESDFDLHVAVLDDEENVVSELRSVTAGDLERSAKASKKRGRGRQSNGANLGFEETLWQAADRMRGHMDPAEYKHVALGLIFLKYISDAFDERYGQLELWIADPQHEYFVKESQARYGVLEDRDEYKSENVFWVPKEARWYYLQANAKQPTIGRLIDDAMEAIERENPSLKGVLAKDYARPTLDKQRLGELIDLVGTIGLGDRESRSKDILGRVYEYFLSKFASAEGRKGGEFYTPRCVV